jgi:uncharacterized protein involved in copper resistance
LPDNYLIRNENTADKSSGRIMNSMKQEQKKIDQTQGESVSDVEEVLYSNNLPNQSITPSERDRFTAEKQNEGILSENLSKVVLQKELEAQVNEKENISL